MPPPRYGYVCAPGYWRLEGRRHEWVQGRWLENRRDHAWVPDRWTPVGHRWHYDPGHWEHESRGREEHERHGYRDDDSRRGHDGERYAHYR